MYQHLVFIYQDNNQINQGLRIPFHDLKICFLICCSLLSREWIFRDACYGIFCRESIRGRLSGGRIRWFWVIGGVWLSLPCWTLQGRLLRRGSGSFRRTLRGKNVICPNTPCNQQLRDMDTVPTV